MFPAIRDAMLNDFECLHDGLQALELSVVELELTQDFEVRGLDLPGWISLHSDAAINNYKVQLETLGVKPCALLTACDLSENEPEAAGAWLVRAMAIAEALGAGVIRVDPVMKAEGTLLFEERVERVVKALSIALEASPDSTVKMGLENHGFYCNSPVFLGAVLDRFPPERVGLTLDTGNFYWWGFPRSEVYALIEQLAPRVVYTHVKNIAYPEDKCEEFRERGWEYGKYWCALHEGSLDMQRIIGILAKAGYDGALCIENEAIGTVGNLRAQTQVLQAELAHLRGCMEK